MWHNGGWVNDTANMALCWATRSELPGIEQTYTEWELKDLNGDGYPDVVFNGSPVARRRPDIRAKRRGPTKCCIRRHERSISPDTEPGNHVEAVLNVRGVLLRRRQPRRMTRSRRRSTCAPQPCGVAKWTYDPTSSAQSVKCGFVDVNGDGLIDRVEDTVTVAPRQGSGFDTACTSRSPGTLSVQNERTAGDARPSADDPAILHDASRSNGLRDLTGDGIPDYLVQDPSGNWTVSVGTGAGFAPRRSPCRWAHVLLVEREPKTATARARNTDSGVFDVDGDGLPDVVYVDGGSLDVYQLAGGVDARARPRRAGCASSTTATARSRPSAIARPRRTARTHQVPSPEIVVTSVELGTSGSAGR